MVKMRPVKGLGTVLWPEGIQSNLSRKKAASKWQLSEIEDPSPSLRSVHPASSLRISPASEIHLNHDYQRDPGTESTNSERLKATGRVNLGLQPTLDHGHLIE